MAAAANMSEAALMRSILIRGVKKNAPSKLNETDASETDVTEKYQVKTTLDRFLKTRLASVAKREGVSESSYLRKLLSEKLEPSAGSESAIIASVEDVVTKKVTVVLPEFLKRRATSKAKSKGMKLSPWIMSLVQSHLLQLPVMTHNELAALNASNRELAAIGRNLNQIAKALNEHFHETDRLKLDFLATLQTSITINREKIRVLVRATQQSWIDEE